MSGGDISGGGLTGGGPTGDSLTGRSRSGRGRSGGSPIRSGADRVPSAIDTSAIADLARHEWALPVGNSAVSVGLLSFYLGAMWARTLPDGAASSRWAAWAMVGLGLGSIVVGQRLRVGWKRHVTAVLAALDRPPARGPHLRASNHQVNRRSWRRHAAHCRVRAAGPKHARP